MKLDTHARAHKLRNYGTDSCKSQECFPEKPWPSQSVKAKAWPPAGPHTSFLYSYFEPMMYLINNDSYVPNQSLKLKNICLKGTIFKLSKQF